MKIFDSISHPTLNGTWFGKPSNNTFDNLIKDYTNNHISGGCAVSLPSITLPDLTEFYKACTSRKETLLFPVAAFDFTVDYYENYIIAVKNIGFTAIKIHPRLSGLQLDRDLHKIEEVFSLCEKHGLIVFFCTYCHGSITEIPVHPLSHYIISLLKKAPTLKVILLHGGDVNLLQISQIARFNSNVLIDLSYTFLKFAGSSLETDIVFLMNNLDKKICFGSDYPDYSIRKFRKKLNHMLQHVPDEAKRANFCYKNIMEFLNLPL